jgi:hypothetical protein
MSTDQAYSEVLLVSPKERVYEFLTNPFVVVGAFGHASALLAMDDKGGRSVQFSDLSIAPRLLRVTYVLSFESERPQCAVGYMEGPDLVNGGLKYTGWTDDDSVSWELVFQITKARQDLTRVGIHLTTNANQSLLSRLLGKRTLGAKHIVQDHLIPFLNLTLNSRLEGEEQDLGQLARKALENARKFGKHEEDNDKVR